MQKILFFSLVFAITLGIVSCKKESGDEPERVYTKKIERNFTNEFEEDLIELVDK